MTESGGDRFMTVILGLGVVLIMLLPVGLIVGGLQTRHKVEPIAGGVQTTGEVSDVTRIAILHGGYSYDPTVSFTDNAGHVHLFTGPSESSPPAIGSRVEVSYDPANPDHAADLSAGSAKWKVPFWIGVVLLALELVLAGWVMVRRRALRQS
jgi:hypothetical protein